MASKITCYLDCVSPYSYYALLHLERNKQTLEAQNVEIDIVPVFLGGINVGSGNKPPWTLPAKANYSQYDGARAKHHFGVPNLQTPSFFPILSLLPQRALCYVKEAHGEKFVAIFHDIYHAMWENGKDVSKPEVLVEVLKQRLKEDEAREVMAKANSPPYKQQLNDNTKEALDRGAFGCPWFSVRNSKGEEEPFFGSDSTITFGKAPATGEMPQRIQDELRTVETWRTNTRELWGALTGIPYRFHYMWEYLGLPWKDVQLLPPADAKAKI